jgi:hypothetical protein
VHRAPPRWGIFLHYPSSPRPVLSEIAQRLMDVGLGWRFDMVNIASMGYTPEANPLPLGLTTDLWGAVSRNPCWVANTIH